MRISEFVMSYEAPIRLGFFFGIFAFMAGWELLAPRRVLNVSKALRWANNLGIVVLNTVLLRLLFPAAAVGIALFAHRSASTLRSPWARNSIISKRLALLRALPIRANWVKNSCFNVLLDMNAQW